MAKLLMSMQNVQSCKHSSIHMLLALTVVALAFTGCGGSDDELNSACMEFKSAASDAAAIGDDSRAESIEAWGNAQAALVKVRKALDEDDDKVTVAALENTLHDAQLFAAGEETATSPEAISAGFSDESVAQMNVICEDAWYPDEH